MLAKKCDRCQKFHDLYTEELKPLKNHSEPRRVNGVMLVEFDTNGEYQFCAALELCRDCLMSFEQWRQEPMSTTPTEVEA